MTKSIILSAALLFGCISAHAYEGESTTQRLVIKCRGYIDNKVSIYLESSMLPNDPSTAVTSLEIGLVVKTWAPKQQFEYQEDAKESGNSIALEGVIGAGQNNFNLSLPWADISGKQTSFVTGLVLKGGVYSGKVAVSCTAELKNIKMQESNQATFKN